MMFSLLFVWIILKFHVVTVKPGGRGMDVSQLRGTVWTKHLTDISLGSRNTVSCKERCELQVSFKDITLKPSK